MLIVLLGYFPSCSFMFPSCSHGTFSTRNSLAEGGRWDLGLSGTFKPFCQGRGLTIVFLGSPAECF